MKATSDTLAPVLLATTSTASYVVDTSGQVRRVRGDERTVIATLDASAGIGRLGSLRGNFSVGEDESIWFAAPNGSGLHVWNGATWSTLDLATALGPAVYAQHVAARALNDAWAIAYVTKDAYTCHWDGQAWTCDAIPSDVTAAGEAFPMSLEMIGNGGGMLAVSPSFVWDLDSSGVVRRRGADGVWRVVGSAHDDSCELAVTGDDHAYLGGCSGKPGVAAWNGTTFVTVDDTATKFPRRLAVGRLEARRDRPRRRGRDLRLRRCRGARDRARCARERRSSRARRGPDRAHDVVPRLIATRNAGRRRV